MTRFSCDPYAISIGVPKDLHSNISVAARFHSVWRRLAARPSLRYRPSAETNPRAGGMGPSRC